MRNILLEAPGRTAGTALEIAVDAVARVNAASAQNGVSILRGITLRNAGPVPLEGLTVTADCRPGLIRPKTWTVDRLAPGASLALPQLDTPLDPALLGGLNEAELGELAVSAAKGEDQLARATVQVEMLARDEWGGLGEMAHLLAAHVSPNDAAVAAVLKEASGLLEAAGHDGAIDGYQSKDPGRVWMLAGAIWSALTGLGLSYAVPPASFETRGQKIRDPGRIRAEGLATCLDSALFLAACYEAAGLNPAVLFSEDHAWTGLWLAERDFGAVTEPDVVAVRKAADARDFVMLETVLLTKRPSIGFEQAASAGRELTAEHNEHAFRMAVDIRRARAARIRPLAARQRDALLLAARQRGGAASGQLFEPGQRQHFPDPGGDPRPAPFADPQRKGDVFRDAEMREERVALEDEAEIPVLGIAGGDVLALHQDAARARRGEARDRHQQGRLARARRPEQRDELALGHLERDPVQRPDPAIGLGERVDGEKRHLTARPAPAARSSSGCRRRRARRPRSRWPRPRSRPCPAARPAAACGCRA